MLFIEIEIAVAVERIDRTSSSLGKEVTRMGRIGAFGAPLETVGSE